MRFSFIIPPHNAERGASYYPAMAAQNNLVLAKVVGINRRFA
jgi:hypothetical protein